MSFLSKERISGRFSFIAGGFFILSALFWQTIKNHFAYQSWFIEPVYPVIDAFQLGLFIIGIIFSAVGLALYTDFWQDKKEALEIRDQKLSIVNNLQKDARQPYQLMELLSLAIKEIVGQLSETSGTIFLVNRSHRQLVLVDTAGLTKQETALMERYPLGQNIITQSIELNEPLISGYFEFIDSSQSKNESRFNSCLILPLVSGSDKIGCIALLSEAKNHFSQTEIKYLMPLAEWLVEKIKSAKLQKDINLHKMNIERVENRLNDINSRLNNIIQSFTSVDNINLLCRNLVGLLGCSSVYLYGLKNGGLYFHGSSEPIGELSENYKTALIDGLDKNKPIIINQEAQNKEGRSYITRSTFIYPNRNSDHNYALMLINEDSPFSKISDDDMRLLSVYADLAGLSIVQKSSHHLNLTRRKGIEKILSLLRFDKNSEIKDDPEMFVKLIPEIVPDHSIGLSFVKNPNGSFKAVKGYHTYSVELDNFDILPGEGIIGELTSEMTSKFIFGREKIANSLNSFAETNRNIFYKLFEEEGIPVFLAACPIFCSETLTGAALFFMYNISEEEKNEWEKLITLANGLYTLRLTINKLYLSKPPGVQFHTTRSYKGGELINNMNNHLNAIIGNAELASLSNNISGETKNHFQSIINEADQAANFLKEKMSQILEESDKKLTAKPEEKYINDSIEEILDKSFISDNMYMIGGRPHEISKSLGGVNYIVTKDKSVRNLFEEAINRFASMTDDEDIITISTYYKEDYVYLDISRHRKNFPAVERVSEFGQYQLPEDVIKYRPVDTFLIGITDGNSYYAFDRHTPKPSYLSFKFSASSILSPAKSFTRTPRILAIDDQTVILDLISAMAQTSGFIVETAQTGEEGLKLALIKHFDVILTDLAMPGFSGLELSREVRKKKQEIPIVLMTGWEVNLDKAQLDMAGISKILYKPFRIEQLTEIIKSFTSDIKKI